MVLDLHGLLGQDVGICRNSLALVQEGRAPQRPRNGVFPGAPFPGQATKMLLFPRGPNATLGCSRPDLYLGLGDSPVGPRFLCLLQGLSVDL